MSDPNNVNLSLMKGKKGVIMGVANDHSIAWGIAQSLSAAGAEIAFSYQSETLKKRVEPLAKMLGSDLIYPCDVESSEDIEIFFNSIQNKWESIDFLVHAIAFSDKNELKGPYYNTTKENFIKTMLISCFSFTEVVKEAQKIMISGGSIITLTFDGANRVMPNYNVMGIAKAGLESSVRYLAADFGTRGIRVNAISAGPIKTLAASGVKNFRKMLSEHSKIAPLGRTVTTEEVGNVASFLCSDYASGITGEITYVDAGFNIAAMPLMGYEE